MYGVLHVITGVRLSVGGRTENTHGLTGADQSETGIAVSRRERGLTARRLQLPDRGRRPVLLHAIGFAECAERDDRGCGLVLWIARDRAVENSHPRAGLELLTLL